MPPAGIRFAGEAAFLALVALGLGLAGFDLIVIGAAMLAAVVLVVLLELVSAKESNRAADEAPVPAAPPHVERVEVEAAADLEPEPQPEPAVDERSARAILASVLPPLPPEERDLEPAALAAGPPREWNLWELQRPVRARPDDDRHEEWSALLIHLREFANADGDLPLEFDALVRESFAVVLEAEPEPAAAR